MVKPERFQAAMMACKNCTQIVKRICIDHPPRLLAISFKTTVTQYEKKALNWSGAGSPSQE